MSQSVTGVQYPQAVGRIDGNTNYASKQYVVANGITINAGDFVYFTSGTVTNATVNGARLIGMAEGTATGNASGTVTVLVCVDPMMRYLIKSTTALTISNNTNSNLGQYFDVTGATGAQTVSVTGTTLGAFLLLDVPGTTTFPNTGINIPSGTTVGLFMIVNNFIAPYVAS
jgi:hypothetical protein